MKTKLLSCALVLASVNAHAEVCNIYDATSNEVKATFNVDIATTNKQRAKGLMFVKSMPENNGMIFIWPDKQYRAMWMKNTYIPLDMLFIDDENIIGIVENAEPHTLNPRTVNKKLNKVLEINALQAQKHGINVNDTIKCN